MTGPSSERTADASDLMKQALDVPFTFDLLRDPEWQPTRENYAALRDAIAEVVARNQQLQEALESGARYAEGVMLRESDPTLRSIHQENLDKIRAALASVRARTP